MHVKSLELLILVISSHVSCLTMLHAYAIITHEMYEV